MNSQLNLTVTSIGELNISSNGKEKGSLECTLNESSVLSIIIQDELGRVRVEKKYNLDAGSHLLTFGTSNLSPGSYKAWIDVNGKTYIRSIVVEGASNQENWFDKIKNFF